METKYAPERGDIVWLTIDPQAGRRPALVLSPKAYNTNKLQITLICFFGQILSFLFWSLSLF